MNYVLPYGTAYIWIIWHVLYTSLFLFLACQLPEKENVANLPDS